VVLSAPVLLLFSVVQKQLVRGLAR